MRTVLRKIFLTHSRILERYLIVAENILHAYLEHLFQYSCSIWCAFDVHTTRFPSYKKDIERLLLFHSLVLTTKNRLGIWIDFHFRSAVIPLWVAKDSWISSRWVFCFCLPLLEIYSERWKRVEILKRDTLICILGNRWFSVQLYKKMVFVNFADGSDENFVAIMESWRNQLPKRELHSITNDRYLLPDTRTPSWFKLQINSRW